ncbi:hypothetical protein ACUXIS_005040 [Cytobacillus horneckiae]
MIIIYNISVNNQSAASRLTGSFYSIYELFDVCKGCIV